MNKLLFLTGAMGGASITVILLMILKYVFGVKL